MRLHPCIRRFLFLQAFITAAFAQEAPLPTGGHAGNVFIGAWDTDADGKVSRAEYDATRTQRFAQTDENSDAVLSADEYVNEYATRLDREIADSRQDFVEQTHTRFGCHEGLLKRKNARERIFFRHPRVGGDPS